MTTTQEIPPMARCTVPPHSAFDLGWTHGPITQKQDRETGVYARVTGRDVSTVPGFWVTPPAR